MTIYYKIQKYLRIPIPLFVKKFFKKYYGKNNLDQQMEKYLNFNNGFYIELGAYDGITQSNTYYYEKNKNWKGLLIEPIEHVFKKCKKNRSKENYFFNNACVSFGNKKEFINFTYQNLNSFSSEIIDEEIKNQYLSNPILLRGEKSFTFSAKAMTLNSILDQSNAPDIIDFFSLDTEGGEFEVLEGIDFERYKFKYMLIETNDFERLKKYLTNKNYIFIEKLNLNDYLFKLN